MESNLAESAITQKSDQIFFKPDDLETIVKVTTCPQNDENKVLWWERTDHGLPLFFILSPFPHSPITDLGALGAYPSRFC